VTVAVVVIAGGAAVAARVLGADAEEPPSASPTPPTASPTQAAATETPAAPAQSQSPGPASGIHPAVVAYCNAVAKYVKNQGAGQVAVNQRFGPELDAALRRALALPVLTKADTAELQKCGAQLKEVYDRWDPNN
jgi:hypothetical protein